MKKKTTKIFVGAAAIALLSGCTDLLNTTPSDKLSSANMWTTAESVDQGVAGIYSALWYMAPGAYNADYPNVGASDFDGINYGSTYGFERWGIAGQLYGGESLTNGSINPSSGYFSNTWKRLYEGVRRANDAIANIPAKAPIDDAKKARLISEAKFLRAWFYFRLNELFGREGLGVPIYTEPTSVDESNKGQSPEADVWKLITDDLTDAIDDPNLPNMDPNGRVTKGAAYALRGKAYLYQGAKYKETTDGSVNVTVNTDLLNKAIADFDKVKECGYGLFGDYKGLFSEENEHCNEMIFSIGHTDDKGYGTNSQKFVGSRFAYSGTGNGWGNQTPAPAGIDQYEYTDGSPFNWDDIIPDYDKLTPKERAVYFLRDTLDINSEIVKQEGDQKPLETLVRSSVKTLVEKAGKTAKEYMPYGNEIRIRKAYQNRDPRLEANIITPYAGFNGGYSFAGAGNPMVVYSRWPLGAKSKTPDVTKRADLATDDSNYFTYFHRKFVYEGAGLSRREDGGLDEPLIRYANVLLWKAEAYVELDKLPEAKACVKEVRDRVKMPILDRYFFDQNSARDYVRAERRREFVNEGVDFFDEMRWYTWKEIKFNQGKGTQTVWGEVWQSYTWPTSNNLYIWPVPQSEVERNPNLTRTPGWNY